MNELITQRIQKVNRRKLTESIFDHFLALFLPITGLLLIVAIGPPFTHTPLVIFIAIIILSSWNGGFSPGVISAISSAVFIVYYFYSPQRILNFNDPMLYFQFILICSEGIVLSFIVDMAKRQEKIKEYKKREQYFNKKVLELEEINRKYEKEIRSRDEFLSIASHELKTPLTSMLLQTQTALHNIRNVSVAHFSFENLLKMLESVENQTKRLSKMINDLLAVSVITVGSLNLEYEEIDLGKLVKGVLVDFQARIEKERIRIVFNAEEKVIGQWDKIRIEQAISNFLSNAIKYGENKPIEIDVKRQGRFAEFIITDHGIGINKHKQKSIFELFQRAVAPEQYKGLGVGLYITQKIIKAHSGTVEIWSKLGKGSRFTMRLPLKKPTTS